MTATDLAPDLIGRTLGDGRTLAAAAGLRLEILESSVVDGMIDPLRIRVRVSGGVIQQAWADPDPGGWGPEPGGS
jgi:hypothetical protein